MCKEPGKGFLIFLVIGRVKVVTLLLHEVACTIVFNSNILHTRCMCLTALTINTDVFLNDVSLTNWSRLCMVQCGN